MDSDQEIISLLWGRDQSALNMIKEKYGSYIARIAQTLLNDPRDVEECLSDAYMQLWQAIPPARPNNLGGFLAATVRNCAIDRLRKQSSQKRGGSRLDLALEEFSELLQSGDDVEQTVSDEMLIGEINALLSEMKPKNRIIFVKRYWYLEPIAQIAEECGMNINTVKSILRRTREQLRRALLKGGDK